MKRVACPSALLALLLTSASATGGIVSGLDLPALVDDADLIVIGSAGGAHSQAGVPAGSLVVTVKVDRVLKGADLVRSRLLILMLDENAVGPGAVTTGRSGMYFLQRLRDGRYEAADPRFPALPAAAAARPHDQETADPLPGVIEELEAVLRRPERGRSAEADRQRAKEALESVDRRR